ncbi:hypothetical protein QZH41_016190 [Actinostola sp. cb2023]|nr:hypothetical protein QZH41_016190 [Actinostola sp. cb2023]
MADDEVKIMTWNINGIRAVTREKSLKIFLDELDVDIICFQETKITRDMLEESICSVEGYNAYFSFSRLKTGYSGTVSYIMYMLIRTYMSFCLGDLNVTHKPIDHCNPGELVRIEWFDNRLVTSW